MAKADYFVDAKPLVEFLERHKLEMSEFNDLFGIGHSTCNGWIRQSKMPGWVKKSIELYDKVHSSKEKGDLYVVYVPGNLRQSFTGFCEALKLEAKKVL